MVSTPSRCNSITTSLPNSPEPNSMTLMAAGDSGVPNFMTVFLLRRSHFVQGALPASMRVRLSLAHNICKVAAIDIALAVDVMAVKSVGRPPSQSTACRINLGGSHDYQTKP